MMAAMEIGANASSVHGPGRRARRLLEQSRESIAFQIGSRADDLVFTSGGTEALDLAIHGLIETLPKPYLLVSAIEHDAAFDTAQSMKVPCEIIPVSGDGVIDLEWLAAKLEGLASDDVTPVVVTMLANNETGVIQPVAQVTELVRRYSGYVICDAVQALGKIKIDLGLLGVDYLALSSHKLGGPQGVGALWVRPDAPLKTQLLGGGQERSRRSGTENLIGIAGFAAAAEAASDLTRMANLAERRDRLEAEISNAANVTIHGRAVDRLPNTSCFSFEGLSSEAQVMAMDLGGVAVSAGSACSSGKVKKSRVLEAMGLSDALASSALRLSFGWSSKESDFDNVAGTWLSAVKRAAPHAFKEVV